MRSKEVISAVSPCKKDLTDPTLQTLDDARKKGLTLCSNLRICQMRNESEKISCVRLVAQQMACEALDRMGGGETRDEAIATEVQLYLYDGVYGKFWSQRDNQWVIIQGRQALPDIASFAKILIGE